MESTLTIPKHQKVPAKRGTFMFAEIPRDKHDALVAEYWKTWLSAWRFRCSNEAAVKRFVKAMEKVVIQAYGNGAMDSVYGITRDDD
jgi:hypothetical protein